MKKNISANQYIKNKNEILEEYFWIKQSRKKIILDYEFCEQKNISRPTFYRWLKELGGYESFIEIYREKLLNNEIFPPQEYQTDFLFNIIKTSLKFNMDELSKVDKFIAKVFIYIFITLIPISVYGYFEFGFIKTLFILYIWIFFGLFVIDAFSSYLKKRWQLFLIFIVFLISCVSIYILWKDF